MHTNQPPLNQVKGKSVYDCREFIDGIDQLIKLRHRWNALDVDLPKEKVEEIELLKRRLTDFVREHSAAKGIYVEGEHTDHDSMKPK